jgi:hypothetical protein
VKQIGGFMSNALTPNDYLNNLSTKLNEWGHNFEEEIKNRRRKIIHSYLEDFKSLDSESVYPWGDLSLFVESF